MSNFIKFVFVINLQLKFLYSFNEEVLYLSIIELDITLLCMVAWKTPIFSQRDTPKNNTIQLEMRKETAIARIRLFLTIPCSIGELFR